MAFLVNSGVVEEDEMELYSYGCSLLIKKIIHTTLILTIGVVTNQFLSMLIFLLTYIVIREYSGGYHAKTELGCYICTISVTVSVEVLFNRLPGRENIAVDIFLVFCAVIIWSLSPQDTKKKPLQVKEYYAYRKKTREFLIISAIILLLGSANTIVFKGITCAWIVQAVMLLVAMSKKVIGQ